MQQGPCTNPSVSSLSLDQSKQSDSLNGKIPRAVLFPLMPNRHFLIKFWKCHKALSILPHEAKALLQLFCLQPILFGYRQNSSNSSLDSWGKIKIHDFTLADQNWIGLMIFKNFADQEWIGLNFVGSGLDSDWKISQSVHLWQVAKLPGWPFWSQISEIWSQITLADPKIFVWLFSRIDRPLARIRSHHSGTCLRNDNFSLLLLIDCRFQPNCYILKVFYYNNFC